jgi:hypothetical protein
MAAVLLETTLHTPDKQNPAGKETTMNLTINSSSNDIRKSIKVQHIALTAGVALAFTAGVVIGSSVRSTEYAASVPQTAPAVRQASEADIAAGVLSSELANFFAEAVPAVESRSVSDADLAAGVLSSELANFIAEAAPAVGTRSVSDADLAASVLSSELANFAP